MDIGKIYTIKLTSGEELLARVISAPSADGFMTISEPISIAPSQKGVGFVPSIFTATPGESVQLNTNNVTLIAVTEDGICDKYVEVTTGIKLPSKNIILG